MSEPAPTGGGGGNGQTRGRDPRCPASAPAPGDPCTAGPAQYQCEYGGDAWHRCSTVAECVQDPSGNFRFGIDSPSSCTPPNPPSCPTNFEGFSALINASNRGPCFLLDGSAGAAAGAAMLACNYGTVSCAWKPHSNPCSWDCVDGNAIIRDAPTDLDFKCPAIRPLAGDSCPQGVTCFYSGGCFVIASLGPAMTCPQGYWMQVHDPAVNCPVR